MDFFKEQKDKQKNSANEAKDKIFRSSIICIFFMVIEFVGGWYSGSLAILSDAAHMLSDFSGFFVSMVSMIISEKKANSQYTYGYHRAQTLGALCSVVTIWFLTVWLLAEAYDRFTNDKIEILGGVMFFVAVIGLGCNIIMIQILHQVMLIVSYFRVDMGIVMEDFIHIVVVDTVIVMKITVILILKDETTDL